MALGNMLSFLSRRLVRLFPSDDLGLEKLRSSVLPWWWARWTKDSEGACFNKLEEPSSWGFGPCEAMLFFLLAASSCHGGDRVEAEMDGVAWEDEARLRRRHAKDIYAGAICGRRRPLRAVVVSCNHGLFFLQAMMPMRRIFDLSVTLQADDDPSGFVPGVAAGRRVSRSCKRCGREEGPDCFFNFYFEVFLVKVEGLFVIFSFFRVLYVMLPAT